MEEITVKDNNFYNNEPTLVSDIAVLGLDICKMCKCK